MRARKGEINAKMKKVNPLTLLALISAMGLAGCGSSKKPASSSANQPQPSSSQIKETNTFGDGITDAEKAILAKLGSGSFVKKDLSSGSNSVITARFELTESDGAVTAIYASKEATAFIQDGIVVYFAIDTKAYTVKAYTFDGDITTHGKDASFKDDALKINGTDGSGSDVVAGATVTSKAVHDLAGKCVAQAKKDYPASEPKPDENKKFSVIFDPNNGTTKYSSVVVKDGELVARPLKDPELADHNFIGWYLGDEKFDFSTPIHENITLVAHYQSIYTFHDGKIYQLPESLSGEVVIPSSIDGLVVTEIGENFAKGNKKITKVTIPSTVTKIDFSAFEDCTSLEKVVYLSQTSSETGEIVRDLTYGINVFRGDTALKEAIVPARALNAASGTFAGCTSITSANIDGISQIGSEMFKDCTALKSVTLGSNVTKINDAAFAGCSSLTSFEAPQYLTSIGQQAFQNDTSLVTVTLNGLISNIGLFAFEGCSALSSFTVDSANTHFVTREDGGLYYKSSNQYNLYYLARPSATSYEFAADVTSFRHDALSNCPKIASFSVAEGNKMFSYADGALMKKSYASASTFTTLEMIAPAYNGDVAIAKDIRLIDSDAFSNGAAKGVQHLTLAEGNTNFTLANGILTNKSSVIFADKSATGNYDVDTSHATIYDNAFAYSNLDSITLASRSLPYTVGNHSFDGVKSGFKIYIPDDCKNTWTDLSFVSSKGWTQSMIDMMEVKAAA